MNFNRVCMYLRKSRADEEAEKHGAGETLDKHESILLSFAKERNINIVKIRKEVVSGESLIRRPKMLKTLEEIEEGLYDGVLVMDMERLGRGNMQEQGLILEAFKESGTKIITPLKTYDLSDEFDEEYSEFEAFMARKELKMINRRLQRGRIRSIKSGNYLGTYPPFGYDITFIGRDRTLKPNEEEAPIVAMIFDLYTNHNMGGGKIAKKLNDLGYKSSRNKEWKAPLVLNVVKNEVYAGRIQWGKKEYTPSDNLSGFEVKTLPKDEWIDVKGKHPGLVSQETFDKAQKILKGKGHVPYGKAISNPLAGLIICAKCGTSMIRRPYVKSDDGIICYNTSCANKGSKLEFVEDRLLKGLEKWLEEYEAQWDRLNLRNDSQGKSNAIKFYKQALNKLQNELKELEIQKNNLHDLLEREIYDIDTYLERSKAIVDRIEATKINIDKTMVALKKEEKNIEAQTEIIPTIKNVLDLYRETDDVGKKNSLLKSVLEKAMYNKERKQYMDEFTLVLYPKLKNKR